jgi:hypothetical protein
MTEEHMYVRIAACLALTTLSIFGDTLRLKNGREYAGILVSASSTRIRFSTGRGVIQSFLRREIDCIEIGDSPATPRATSVESTRTPAASEPAVLERSQPAPAAAQAVPPTAPPPPPLTIPEVGTNSTTGLSDLGAIDSEYTAIGADTGVLGPPRAPTQPTRDGRALVRFYANGAIYWTPGGGAHAIYGPIMQAWIAAGGENSRVGYPISDEEVTGAGYSHLQRFEGGTITWTPDRGARIEYTSPAR